MVISMSQPWKHPKTGVWYFRGRMPAPLKAVLEGQKATLQIAGAVRVILLKEIVKVSLGTKDIGEAKVRHAAVQAQLQQRWAMARQSKVSLSHEEILSLAGLAYRDQIAEHRSEPGDAEAWKINQELIFNALQHFDRDSDGVTSEPYDPARGERELAKHVDLDQIIGARAQTLNTTTRRKLLCEVAYALTQASTTLARYAEGDYSRDDTADRFPPLKPDSTPLPSAAGAEATDVDSLITGWARETSPKQKTIDLWRSYIGEFVRFVGYSDARRFRRQDVLGWKQKLLDDGASVKTINDSKLAALKAVLGWGTENELLTENAAARVSVKRKAKPGEGMKGFTLDEAATILAAASSAVSPVYRWVPLLCAGSGARVSEICQLRPEDIEQRDGVWFMHIRAEAGSVKNANSEREVPLHPQIIDAGFLTFVRSKSGRLFFDTSRRSAKARRPQPAIVAKNVARWVHTLGIEVGRKKYRKDPNHGWRHVFTTLCREAGIQDSVVDAITGHGPASVGQAYGQTWLSTAAAAIEKIKVPFEMKNAEAA